MPTTVMLAISYIDKFLESFENLALDHLQLVGITAVILAVKMNEQCFLSVQTAIQDCDGIYSVDNIERCEMIMLQLLSFKMNMPIPFDIAYYMLQLANDDFDFTEILFEAA